MLFLWTRLDMINSNKFNFNGIFIINSASIVKSDKAYKCHKMQRENAGHKAQFNFVNCESKFLPFNYYRKIN